MKSDSFVFYRSFYEAIKELPDEERVKVYDAICVYGLEHQDITGSGIAKGMMALIRPQLDANYKKRMNGTRGGRPKTDKSGEEPEDTSDNQGKKPNQDETKIKPNNNQSITKGEPNVNVNVNANVNANELRKETTKEKKFTRPSLEDVKAYCQERRNNVDPERWMAYYESNGFKVGRNPMKDWRACVRNWERNAAERPVDTLPTYNASNNTRMSSEEEKELLALMGKA